MASKIWENLSTLAESIKYRGTSDTKFSDIEKLIDAISKKGLLSKSKVDPNGGWVECKFEFSPKIWKGWMQSADAAMNHAATDKTTVNTYAGKPQGDKVFKTTWGQKVVAQQGKARTDFERHPSAYTLYDLFMVAEIIDDGKGILTKVAYSPAIGSFEERSTRIKTLLAGNIPPPPSKRPQPIRPGSDARDPTKIPDDLDEPKTINAFLDKIKTSVPDVQRAGTGHMGRGYKLQRDPHDKE